MRIGAYQFDVTANIENNYSHIKKGILEACKSGVRLLVFPECAVTGYPPPQKDTRTSIYYGTGRVFGYKQKNRI